MILLSLSAVVAQDGGVIELPEQGAYPVDSIDDELPGFAGNIHQARKNSGLTATIARGNAQLGGSLIDPQTDEPFVNLAVDTENEEFTSGDWDGTMAVEPGGRFVLPGVINFSADEFGFPLDIGNFTSFDDHEDLPFPGVPGAEDDSFSFYDNGLNFAVEFVAFLHLPEGETLLGVHHDDAVEIAFHPNDARDIFRQRLVGFDSNSGQTDRTVVVDAPVEGLYHVRVLLAQWTGETSLEFYAANGDNTADIALVNDDEIESSLNAWRGITVPTRPYVSSVQPAVNATGVSRDTAISVTLENLVEDDDSLTMKVNGALVTFESERGGNTTTLTFEPESPFGSGETVNVELTYGAATASWTFVAESGAKALLITGGGQLNSADGWVANRLASKFGFDVVVKSDGAVSVDDADEAAMIFNSSTVNSGNVADNDFELLAIPMINVEAGNVDDFLLGDAPYTWGNGPNGGHRTFELEDTDHPIAAGLDPGELEWANANVQFHYGVPPLSATVIGRAPTNPEFGVLYALEAGAEILTDDIDPFVHPARRVFFGFTGNDGAASYNDVGIRLFDAAVEWVLGSAGVTPDAGIAITEIDYAGAGGGVTIKWRSVDADVYSVSESIDLETWIEIDDGVEGTGEETSFTIGNVPDGKNYYRVSSQ